ncbi:hypothetical protein HZS_4155 [Henneguya salminicola]|nr:hypothetical protein HZS_4155 [Henneguya salminicola]
MKKTIYEKMSKQYADFNEKLQGKILETKKMFVTAFYSNKILKIPRLAARIPWLADFGGICLFFLNR